MIRKRILILGLIFVMLLPSCNNKSSVIVDVGMTREEIDALSEEYTTVKYHFYYFITDGKKIVVALYNYHTDSVEEVKEYNYRKTTKNNAYFIREGMDVFDVVRLLGMPKDSETSGIISLPFYLSDNTKVTVCWTIENDRSMRVFEFSIDSLD